MGGVHGFVFIYRQLIGCFIFVDCLEVCVRVEGVVFILEYGDLGGWVGIECSKGSGECTRCGVVDCVSMSGFGEDYGRDRIRLFDTNCYLVVFGWWVYCLDVCDGF